MRVSVDRAVEVLHDRGPGRRPRWTVGSGFLVGNGRVLTAAHNVGAGKLLIRVGGDREYRAAVVVSGSGELADVALLEITDPAFDQQLDPVRFARIDRRSPEPVSGCWAVGFPRFKEKPQSSQTAPWLRDSAHLQGKIPPGANLVSGLLELQVTATPRALPVDRMGESEWQGISGAVVFGADEQLGDCAVGVVVEHHRPEGESSLTVVPITALESLDQAEERERWWDLLGVADPSKLAVFPRRTERESPDYWATVEEIAQRAPVLLGRDGQLVDLATFATGTEGYRWLVGGPWAGKSALVAHFMRAAPPEVDCVAYFLVRRLSDADSGRFTAVVSGQLTWLLDQDPPARLDDPVLFRGLWAQAVARAEQTGRHLLLVVDGLDEDLSRQLGRPSVAALLPFRAGGRSHVLITSRPYPKLPGDVDADHPLRQVQPIKLDPSLHAKAIAQRATQELDELLDRRDSDELAAKLVALLAAAEGALGASDLTELISQNGSRMQRRQVERVVSQDIARLLQPIGAAPAYRYAFAHDQLRARSAEEFDEELASYRARIFAWAEHYRTLRWPVDATPEYLLDAYPALLAREAVDKLPALLTDLAYLDTAIARVGVDRIASAVRKTQDLSLADVDLGGIGRCLDQEAHHLRRPYPLDKPGYAMRQLCLQALEGGHIGLASRARQELMSLPLRLIPRWTSRHASGALVRTMIAHTAPVTAVAITADGSQAISSSSDGTLRRWDLATGQQFGGPLTGHSGPVTAVAITPDGSQAISGGDDRTLRRWDLASSQQLGDPLTGHGRSVSGVAITPDGRQAISSSYDGLLRRWDLNSGQQLGRRLSGHITLTAVAITPDGSQAVSGSYDGTLRRWDLASGQQLGDPLTGHISRVNAVAITPDGRYAVSAGGDRTLRRWDLATGHAHTRTLTGHSGPVTAVAISPDGSHAVSAGEDRTLRRWDLASSQQLGDPLTAHDGPVTAVAISPDGRRAVSAGEDRTLRRWDLATGQQFDGPVTSHDWINAVAITPDGSQAVTAGDDRTLRRWDLTSGQELGDPFIGHLDRVNAVAITSDGRHAVSAGDDRTLRRWDLATGQQHGDPLTGHTLSVTTVAITPDGSQAVSASYDGTLRRWDLNSGQQLGDPLTDHIGKVNAIAITPDGAHAVSIGEDRTLQVWDLLSDKSVDFVALNAVAVGRAIADGSDGFQVLTGDSFGATTAWLFMSTRKPNA